MTWQSLTALVHELLPLARKAPPLPARERAALVVVSHFGFDVVQESPAMVNVGALTIAMSDRLRVHELRAPVPETIAETDLHELPSEPPTLLRGPVLLEVRDPSRESLLTGPRAWPEWRHTGSIGAYELDGTWYIIGLGWPDGVAVATWTPRWGESLDDARLATSVVGEIDAGAYYDWGREAVRSLVVLGLLLDASQTPLAWSDDAPRPFARTTKVEHQPARPWAVRRVYLDATARRSPPSGAPAHDEPSDRSETDRELAAVPVRGYLRRQPYGPQSSLRRWVYVQSHEARRWVSPRPIRVVVGQRGQA